MAWCFCVRGYDVCLIAPTISSLRNLISIVESWCYQLQIKINPAKSVLLSAGECADWYTNINVFAFGEEINRKNSTVYLGFHLYLRGKEKRL